METDEVTELLTRMLERVQRTDKRLSKLLLALDLDPVTGDKGVVIRARVMAGAPDIASPDAWPYVTTDDRLAELLERTSRTETRLCRLMTGLGLDPVTGARA